MSVMLVVSFAKGVNKCAVIFYFFLFFLEWCTCSLVTDVFFLPLLKLCELSRVRFENLFIKVRLARRSFLADLLIGIERNTSQVSANVHVFPHLYLKNTLRDILIMYYTDMS